MDKERKEKQMKAKLMINDKEFEVEISEEQVQALTETKKKTGYERVGQEELYYIEIDNGNTNCFSESFVNFDFEQYKCANYYSDRTLAENNARADRLYRQLRRFAVEHRETAIDWNNDNATKYCIALHHGRVEVGSTYYRRVFAGIYYDTKETAQLAIDTFKDELIWYFTEYKDSL